MYNNRVKDLRLAFNNLAGALPSFFTNMTGMGEIFLQYNLLTVTIPDSISKLTALNYLNLSHNQLSGAIPASLGKLKYLDRLDLSYNQLSGDLLLSSKMLLVDKNQWTMPGDAPTWFRPTVNSLRYWREDDFDQGSRYFCDTITGNCFIYEIQL